MGNVHMRRVGLPGNDFVLQFSLWLPAIESWPFVAGAGPGIFFIEME